MPKLRESIWGKKGKNLDDLEFMTGMEIRAFGLQIFLDSTFFWVLDKTWSDNTLEFVHTGDLESLNALLLKYAKKTHAFRLVLKESNSLIHTRVSPIHMATLSVPVTARLGTRTPTQGGGQSCIKIQYFPRHFSKKLSIFTPERGGGNN